MKYKGIFASSSDDSGETLSKTVEGVVIGASSLIVFFGTQLLGLQITASDVSALATELGTIVGAVVIVYGLIKKVLNKVATE